MKNTVNSHIRISDIQHASIKKHIYHFLPDAQVFLFGSRSNPLAKGGDIDLLLLTKKKVSVLALSRLKRLILNDIGEQKLDIVNFQEGDRHPFKSLVLETAICL